MKISTETLYEIWNDDTGERIVIGQDRDSLGLIELRSLDCNGKSLERFTLTVEQARHTVDAILKVITDLSEVNR
jgi:hypothetical protein